MVNHNMRYHALAIRSHFWKQRSQAKCEHCYPFLIKYKFQHKDAIDLGILALETGSPIALRRKAAGLQRKPPKQREPMFRLHGFGQGFEGELWAPIGSERKHLWSQTSLTKTCQHAPGGGQSLADSGTTSRIRFRAWNWDGWFIISEGQLFEIF